METQRTTIVVNKRLWKRFRMLGAQEGKSASRLVEDIMKEKLAKI